MLFLFCEPAIIFVENPSQAATSISYFPGMYSLFTAEGGSSSEPLIITLLREFLTGEELLCVKDLWRLFFFISSVNLSSSVSDTTVMSNASLSRYLTMLLRAVSAPPPSRDSEKNNIFFFTTAPPFFIL